MRLVPIDFSDTSNAAVTYGIALARNFGARLFVLHVGDQARIEPRHVADSLRAAAYLSPDDRTVIDLGSGGGLPGVVVAIATPHVHVELVESRVKRVAFLEWVVESLGDPRAGGAAAAVRGRLPGPGIRPTGSGLGRRPAAAATRGPARVLRRSRIPRSRRDGRGESRYRRPIRA